MMRRLVVANWKMNQTVPQGIGLAESIAESASRRTDVDVVICPPYTALTAVGKALKGGTVSLGAQDVFWEEKGAFTGQISASMLLDAACTYCIVGHSEKRGRFGGKPPSVLGYFSETDETVALKISALSYAGITAILCVGETKGERDAGKTEEVISQQIEGACSGLAQAEIEALVIAYEPVWAIGTGNVCDSEEAARVCTFIRDKSADQVRVLYGGSVTAQNCSEFFARPEIDGALVGGASLKAEDFAKIVFAA